MVGVGVRVGVEEALGVEVKVGVEVEMGVKVRVGVEVRVQAAAVTVRAVAVMVDCCSGEGPHPASAMQAKMKRKQRAMRFDIDRIVFNDYKRNNTRAGLTKLSGLDFPQYML